MSLVDRLRLWRESRAIARERNQAARCDAGKHHWKYEMDRIACFGPGCGKRYGA